MYLNEGEPCELTDKDLALINELLEKEVEAYNTNQIFQFNRRKREHPEYPEEISHSEEIDTSRVKHRKLLLGSTVNFARAIHYTSAVSGIVCYTIWQNKNEGQQ